jgi:hypothetical protein
MKIIFDFLCALRSLLKTMRLIFRDPVGSHALFCLYIFVHVVIKAIHCVLPNVKKQDKALSGVYGLKGFEKQEFYTMKLL